MNYKKVYSDFIEKMFEDHGRDIERTISYINSNQAGVYKWRPDFEKAVKHLTAGEKNDIIWKIITPF